MRHTPAPKLILEELEPRIAPTVVAVTFQKSDYAVGDAPVGIATGDFNDDGRLDLAVVNQEGDSVSILYGQSGGGFGGKTDYPVGNYPRPIVTGHFNGDGRLDLDRKSVV